MKYGGGVVMDGLVLWSCICCDGGGEFVRVGGGRLVWIYLCCVL